MLTLTIEDDQGRKTDVPVSGLGLTIGRARENQLRLNERNISRKHARLSQLNGAVVIEDLDSYNGTRVNGDRITGSATLFLGDRVQVGDFQLQVNGDLMRPRAEEVTQKTTVPKPRETAAPRGKDEVTSTEPMMLAPIVNKAAAAQEVKAPPKQDRGSFDDGSTALIRLSDMSAPRPAAGPVTGASPRLVCVKGPMAGQEWPVKKAEVVIGRGQENDVCIDHRSMSRAHAKLVLSGTTYRIVDMGSANGTLVNGEQYAQVDLKKGDTIELGHVKLRLVWPGESAPSVEAPQDTAFDESTEIGARPRRVKEAERSVTSVTSPANSKKGLLIVGGVGLGVAVVAAVLVFAFQDEPAKPTAPPPAPVAAAPQQPAQPNPQTPPPPVADNRVGANAQDVMRRASAEMADENWEQATRILELGLDADNGNAALKAALDKAEFERANKSSYDLGNTAFQRGEFQSAREFYQQVADSSMYYPRAQKKQQDPRIKNARNSVPAKTPAQAKPSKPEVAEKSAPAPAPAAVKEEPTQQLGQRDQAKKLFDAGNKSLMQNRLKEAIEYYLEATRTDPKFALPHRGLGIAHARAGNGDAAVEHYRLYLQALPGAPDAEQVKRIIKEYDESGD